MTSINELIIKSFSKLPLNATLQEALDNLQDKECSLSIILKEEKIYATLSKSNILKALLRGATKDDPAVNYAVLNPVCIKGHRSLDYIIQIMVENNIKRVPLTDKDDRPIGIINHDNVIEHFFKEQNFQPIKAINIFGEKIIYSIKADTGLDEMTRIILDKSIGILPVVDENNIPLGVVSESDILNVYKKNSLLKASDIMREPLCVGEFQSIEEIIYALNKNYRRHALITSKSGILIGVISKRDILRNLKNSYIARLERRSRYIKTAFDFFDIPIFEVSKSDEAFIVRWHNQAAKTLFDEDPTEKNIADVFPKAACTLFYENGFDKTIKELNINNRYFNFSAKSLEDGEYIVFLTEITETLKYQRILKEHNLDLEAQINKRTWELLEANDEVIRNQEMLEAAHKVAKLSNWTFIAAQKKFIFYPDIKNLLPGIEMNCTEDDLKNYFEHRDIDELFSKTEIAVQNSQDFSLLLTTTKTHGSRNMRLKGKPYHIEDEKVISLFGTIQDITEERLLEKKASIDELTGIYNRRKFNDICEFEFNRFERFGTVFSIMMIDIDFFKKINDTYGHLVGDEVLKALSFLVQQEIRSTDVFARWGGEEFIILTIEQEREKAILLAEKLRRTINTYAFPHIGHMTCSFGVAEIDKNGIEHMLARADEALYKAKKSGRNKVCNDTECFMHEVIQT